MKIKRRDLFMNDTTCIKMYFYRILEQNKEFCPTLEKVMLDCGMMDIKKRQLIDFLEREDFKFIN